VPETTSTNDDAQTLLGDPGAAGMTIVTDFQTAGSGRHGRRWIAAPGSALLFTTILPDPLPADALWSVPFLAGLVVHAALKRHGVSAQLQWPNDALLNGGKIAGILCISRGIGARAWAACGIGINVERTDDSAPANIAPPPAYVRDVSTVSRSALLASILQELDRRRALLDNPNRIVRKWEEVAQLAGTRYVIHIDGDAQPFAAIGRRIGPGGSLVVEQNGTERAINLADARILRNPG